MKTEMNSATNTGDKMTGMKSKSPCMITLSASRINNMVTVTEGKGTFSS